MMRMHHMAYTHTHTCRATLAKFISELQGRVDEEQRSAAGTTWMPPNIGVFVLHNKRKPKAADLPAEVLQGRYFCGEESDNVCIAYPFNTGPDAQPVQHGEHASGAQPAPARRSYEQHHRATTPRPVTPGAHQRDVLRTLSSHYVETILETAVEQQRLVERFAPTMLLAASDGALPAARLLRHYLRFRAHKLHAAPTSAPTATDAATTTSTTATPQPTSPTASAAALDLPLLTPRLELFDEDTNPYLAHISGVREWGPASLAGQHVLIVDRADDTRVSLAAFFNSLQAAVAGAKEAAGGGAGWRGDPVFGVFVLHRKNVAKAADLPADVLADRCVVMFARLLIFCVDVGECVVVRMLYNCVANACCS